jgi:class 3 adenylate cyclase
MRSTRQFAAWQFVVVLALLVAWVELDARWRVDREAQALSSIAVEIAGLVDGDAHERIRDASDANTPEFLALRKVLREGQDRRGLRSPVYTLRPVQLEGGELTTEFVVMTNPTPFIGDRYRMTETMRPVFDEGVRATTGLYGDAHGRWISGYGPVRDRNGQVVALVEVDLPAGPFLVNRARRRLLALLAAVVIAGLLSLLQFVAFQRKSSRAVLRQILLRRLAVRIGAAAGAVVVLAMGLSSWMDHRVVRQEVIEGMHHHLRTTVRLGAMLVDAGDHRSVERAQDPASSEFLHLREQLRQLRQVAELDSDVYTLIRDGDITRFIVMTNEVPFIGDLQELRPGLRATFDGAGAGSEGPYTNATGNWISAWAPIHGSEGEVVAVLQADYSVATMLAELANRNLERLLFSLFGLFVAFIASAVVGARIAQPIRQVAAAAAEIEGGNLDIEVPETREDEVGNLGRAVNSMARGLREREWIRETFGRYTSPAVVEELTAQRGDVVSSRRHVCVMFLDLRGFTSYAQQHSPEDVVDYLNALFDFMIESVNDHNGWVHQLLGDGFLAIFGAPVAHDNDCQDAVDAALEISRRLDVEMEAGRIPPTRVGIGIHAGTAVVGTVGSRIKKEYKVTGDVVNVTARIESMTKDFDTRILISEAVYAAVTIPEDASVSPLGPLPVRGRTEAVVLYALSADPRS